MQLTREALKEGIDQNIVVYDSDDNNNDKLTLRLVALMRTIARHNYNRVGSYLGKSSTAPLDTIYIGEDVNYAEDVSPPISVSPKNPQGLMAAGLEIIRDRRLNKGGELDTYYFEEEGCCVAFGDVHLLVATGSDYVLLGSC